MSEIEYTDNSDNQSERGDDTGAEEEMEVIPDFPSKRSSKKEYKKSRKSSKRRSDKRRDYDKYDKYDKYDSKKGFMAKTCLLFASESKTKTLTLCAMSYAAMTIVFYFLLKKASPGFVMTKPLTPDEYNYQVETGMIAKGDPATKPSTGKLIVYSLIFGLIGPAAYVGYSAYAMK